jgi:hypothetical protein
MALSFTLTSGFTVVPRRRSWAFPKLPPPPQFVNDGPRREVPWTIANLACQEDRSLLLTQVFGGLFR